LVLLRLRLSASAVPLDALHLARRRVSSASEIVVSLQTRRMCVDLVKLLRAFAIVNFFKEALLLALCVAHVERVASVLALKDRVVARAC